MIVLFREVSLKPKTVLWSGLRRGNSDLLASGQVIRKRKTSAFQWQLPVCTSTRCLSPSALVNTRQGAGSKNETKRKKQCISVGAGTVIQGKRKVGTSLLPPKPKVKVNVLREWDWEREGEGEGEKVLKNKKVKVDQPKAMPRKVNCFTTGNVPDQCRCCCCNWKS